MDDSRTAGQAVQRELKGYKRKPGRTGENWMDIIRRDPKDKDTCWGEAEEPATDKAPSTCGPVHLSACGLK